MGSEKFKFGMIGLGTMGRNLLLNMADHGFEVAGYDKDPAQKELLDKEEKNKNIKGFLSITEFVESLEIPRVIMMLVPAGPIVDAVISELEPLLSKDDIIIDGGNSHFTDTTERIKRLENAGLHFFGMGISGGEKGARYGPSMMPGGDLAAYKHMQPVFEAIAAKVNDEPCVTYIGPGASGHFVKMVHNGIEYALMQLIADTYQVLKTIFQFDNNKIGEIIAGWNKGELECYLLEITADIFAYKNSDETFLIDQIKDEAKSKGTGKWTTQAASDLGLPVTTIDIAVAMRELSKYKALREKTETIYPNKNKIEKTDPGKLESAFYFSMICIYAQGMHLLAKASSDYNYDLKLADIAKIWRGGCIIRSKLLNKIYQAYAEKPELEHLLLDKEIQSVVRSHVDSAREIIADVLLSGVSIPAYTDALSYFDAVRTGRMPSNLIQAQRDYFGAHTYKRIDREGVFHTEWQSEENES